MLGLADECFILLGPGVLVRSKDGLMFGWTELNKGMNVQNQWRLSVF